MIHRNHGLVSFECDFCAEVLDTHESDFRIALNMSAREGWLARKWGDVWKHSCAKCARDEATKQPAKVAEKPKMPVWSYSFLSKYEQCPRQAYYLYVAPKDQRPPYVESPQQKIGNDGHKAMERRLSVGEPLPPAYQAAEGFALGLAQLPVQAELKLGITSQGQSCAFFADDVWGRGTADVVVVQGPVAQMYDWKWANRREDPKELRVQALLLHARYPHLTRIVGNYVWMREGKLGVPHDLSDTGAIWRSINGQMETIRKFAEMDHWPPKEGPLCAFCNVAKCEFRRAPK